MTTHSIEGRPSHEASIRQITAVLCLLAGVMHVASGLLITVMVGLSYIGAAITLFSNWSHARTFAIWVAGIRGAGTCFLLLLKVPDLYTGTLAEGQTVMVYRDAFWIVVNGAILGLALSAAPAKRIAGRGTV